MTKSMECFTEWAIKDWEPVQWVERNIEEAIKKEKSVITKISLIALLSRIHEGCKLRGMNS